MTAEYKWGYNEITDSWKKYDISVREKYFQIIQFNYVIQENWQQQLSPTSQPWDLKRTIRYQLVDTPRDGSCAPVGALWALMLWKQHAPPCKRPLAQPLASRRHASAAGTDTARTKPAKACGARSRHLHRSVAPLYPQRTLSTLWFYIYTRHGHAAFGRPLSPVATQSRFAWLFFYAERAVRAIFYFCSAAARRRAPHAAPLRGAERLRHPLLPPLPHTRVAAAAAPRTRDGRESPQWALRAHAVPRNPPRNPPSPYTRSLQLYI